MAFLSIADYITPSTKLRTAGEKKTWWDRKKRQKKNHHVFPSSPSPPPPPPPPPPAPPSSSSSLWSVSIGVANACPKRQVTGSSSVRLLAVIKFQFVLLQSFNMYYAQLKISITPKWASPWPALHGVPALQMLSKCRPNRHISDIHRPNSRYISIELSLSLSFSLYLYIYKCIHILFFVSCSYISSNR